MKLLFLKNRIYRFYRFYRFYCLLAIWVCMITAHSAYANVGAYDFPSYELSQHENLNDYQLLMLVDDSEFLTLTDVLNSRDWRLQNNSFSEGTKRANLWFRFKLSNQSDKALRRSLILNKNTYQSVTLFYRYAEQTEYQSQRLDEPYKGGALNHLKPIFEITLAPGEELFLVLKIEPSASSFGKIMVLSEDAKWWFLFTDLALHMVLIGMVLVVFLYTFILGLILRDPLFLIYSSISGFMLYPIMYFSGHFIPFLNQEWMALSVRLVFISLVFFALKIYDVDALYPKIARAIKAVLLIAILLVLWSFVSGYLLLQLFPFVNAFWVLVVLVMVVWVLFTKPLDNFLRFYSLFFLVLLVLGVVRLLLARGIIEFSFWADMGYLFAFVLEMLFGSILLAYRVKQADNQRMRAEAQLAELQEMKLIDLSKTVDTSNAALQETNTELQHALEKHRHFKAQVSHEFRNPVAIIKNQLELMQAEKEAGVDHFNLRSQAISAANKRLEMLFEKWIINDRVNHEDFQCRNETVNLYAIKDELLPIFKQLYPDHKIVFLAERFDFRADKDLMVLVLFNLLDNACKYSPAQTTVSISGVRFDNGIKIAVCDQGEGIPANRVKLIMQSYQRDRRHDDSQIYGTGIGLHLVDKIVALHQGRLEIESNNGRGTCVFITLPRSEL